MLAGTLAFASNTVDSSNLKMEIENKIEEQDCNQYASEVADDEVGLLENFITKGQAYLDSYNYWLGYCEGASAGGSEVLKPAYID